MLNQSIHASPMATRTMNSIDSMYQNGQWAKSRGTALVSFAPVAGDAVLVHAPLAIAKAAVAVTFKAAELSAAAFGKDVNLNDMYLSHYTGAEAINHAGKVLGAVLVMASSVLGLIRPDLTVAVSRALGNSRTPEVVKEEPKTRLQQAGEAISRYTNAVKIKNAVNACISPVRNHPRIAIAALATGIAAAAEYKYGFVQNSGVSETISNWKNHIFSAYSEPETESGLINGSEEMVFGPKLPDLSGIKSSLSQSFGGLSDELAHVINKIKFFAYGH
jgi:hypothetical protein